jgi:hypothetical protein
VKVGDMVESSYHTIWGIIVEVGSHLDADHGPAALVKWFDGDESLEWVKFLRTVSTVDTSLT